MKQKRKRPQPQEGAYLVVTHRKIWPFTNVPNKMLHDERLSVEATAISCFLESFPDLVEIKYEPVMERFGFSWRKTDRYLHELIDAGYLKETP